MISAPQNLAKWALLGLACCCAPRELAAQANLPAVESIQLHGQVLDEAGRAAAGIKVVLNHYVLGDPSITRSAVSDERGEFTISVSATKTRLASSAWLEAATENGSQRGIARFPWEDIEKTDQRRYEIRLQPARSIRLKVADADGLAVADARVAVQADYPWFGVGRTDAAGMAEMQMPAQLRIQAVVAWKDDEGLDYRAYAVPQDRTADALAKSSEFPASGEETLVLEGAKPVRVRLMDEQHEPLAGVKIYPWYLQKEGQPQELHTSFLISAFSEASGKDGRAAFRWMPRWQERPAVLSPIAPQFVHSRIVYDPKQNGPEELDLQLIRQVPLRGRVTLPDGSPAAGIEIHASGAGYAWDSGRAETISDARGQYELLVDPDQIYLVVAGNQQWAAAPQTGFAVFKNQPVEGKDFRLRAATRVHGRLLSEWDSSPLADQYVSVYQYGQDLHSMPGTVLANPKDSRSYVRPMYVRRVKTDAAGRFEFRLGDGSFDIRPPGESKATKFQIAGEAELPMELRTTIIAESQLKGQVVLDENSQAVANAVVSGMPRSFRGSQWKAVADAKGRFEVKRRQYATVVYGHSADKKLAAIVEMDAERTDLVLRLKPVGSVRGQLIDEATGAALPEAEIQYGVQIEDENDHTFMNGFGGHVITDKEGKFSIAGLAQGVQYDLSVTIEKDTEGRGRSWRTVEKVLLDRAEMVDLGAVKLPKPYRPPTLEERTAAAFAVQGTPQQRYRRALERGKLLKQRLLVVFGDPADKMVRAFFDARYNDGQIGAVRDDYLFMAIPTDAKQGEAAAKLATKLGESLAGEHGGLLLVILDEAGKKLAMADRASLSTDGAFSRPKLLELLQEHRITPLDGNQLLAAALAQAKRENKRVIAQETATWCGPCQMLSQFLKKHPVWEKDYILVKMDHRWTGARERMEQFRQDSQGGIPWLAILDSDGTLLATSNDAKSGENIGYPSDDVGRRHFRAMLIATRQRLTDDEIAGLIDALNK